MSSVGQIFERLAELLMGELMDLQVCGDLGNPVLRVVVTSEVTIEQEINICPPLLHLRFHTHLWSGAVGEVPQNHIIQWLQSSSPTGWQN